MRNTGEVLDDIKDLVKEKGYIYALCMIIFEDFHIDPEKIQEIDNMARMSIKEASLLIGLFIQNEVNFSTPNTPQDLIQLKKKTYELMRELHESFMIPFFEKLQKSFEQEHKKENYRKDQKEFFGNGEMLIEPIFYSGTGVYDFQYTDFLERKYKYDKQWLLDNKGFDIEKSKNIVFQIKNILQEKSKKVHLYGLKERLPQIIEDMRKKDPTEDWKKHTEEMLPMMELHQYVELFFEYSTNEKELNMDDIREEGWKSFYRGLIELFIIRKSDFGNELGIDSFLENFSTPLEVNMNSQFKGIGNFNIINAKPIIQLDEERYFVPLSFLLFEAIYENPFYWMKKGDKLLSDAVKHRGEVGEEIAYEFLSKVFTEDKTFKSVRIVEKKGHDTTDIDVLCILGSKALCIQIKSKKLTELARTGDDNQLQKDFNGAVQDAYIQGLKSRQKILEGGVKFLNKDGKEIFLSEEIDEVYIMGITTENYPSLTHQSSFMLEKDDNDPFPIFSTIFDLELMVHYLSDPYDFLYYIRQRTSLMDYYKADEEMVYLGYHLDQKLWKIPKIDNFAICNDFGQLIHRNYYPFRAGLDISDEGDVIKNRWKNNDFNHLINSLKTLNEAKVTDIIFYLFDWSGNGRKNLIDLVLKTKQQTLNDGKFHNFSMPPDNSYYPRVGVTYMSLNSNSVEELRRRLLTLCQARKYKSKGDIWIGFGSLKDSTNMIDVVAFNDKQWEYDASLEELAKIMLEGNGQGKYFRLGKKLGRNDKCSCGSGFKYKKCCLNV